MFSTWARICLNAAAKNGSCYPANFGVKMSKFNFRKIKNLVKKLSIRISREKFLIPLTLLTIFLLLVTISLSTSQKQKTLTNEDKIIERVQQFEEVTQFKDLPAQTRLLGQKEIEERAKNFPLIYKDLSGEIYEVRFSSQEGGILLLYDAASDKILRTFNLLQWDQ